MVRIDIMDKISKRENVTENELQTLCEYLTKEQKLKVIWEIEQSRAFAFCCKHETTDYYDRILLYIERYGTKQPTAPKASYFIQSEMTHSEKVASYNFLIDNRIIDKNTSKALYLSFFNKNNKALPKEKINVTTAIKCFVREMKRLKVTPKIDSKLFEKLFLYKGKPMKARTINNVISDINKNE